MASNHGKSISRFQTLVLVLLACLTLHASPQDKYLKGELGLRIPEVGIAVDALYDPRLDVIAPGYKMLNIIVVNDSAQKLFFNPKKDHWKITDAFGKDREAIVSLREKKKSLWAQIKPDMQANIDYPIALNPGQKVMFSIFFKDKVELRDFRAISFYNAYLKKVLTYYSPGIPWEGQEALTGD